MRLIDRIAKRTKEKIEAIKKKRLEIETSTAIYAPTYDEESLTMDVRYRSTPYVTYTYMGVLPSEAKGLEEADSAGSYSYYNIRPHNFRKSND